MYSATVPAGISPLSAQTSGDQFRGWLYHLDDVGEEPLDEAEPVRMRVWREWLGDGSSRRLPSYQ